MSSSMARIAALSLSTLLFASACTPGGDATPANGAGIGNAASGGDGASQISGAGASFIYPLVSKWSADYNKATGNQVNYQSIGSGGGIAQIKAGTVDFGSSDKPLSSEELAEAGLGQFPSAIGGVVPVINIEGLAPGALKLTGPLLADIFLGKIETWNAPAIATLNPGVKLPSEKISIIHRSDGSGTTFNFSNYLSKVSPEWKSKVGEGTSVQWPGGIGGKGNEGVASYVQQVKGAIGYVELAYALQNDMPYASMQNAAGKFVQPDADSFAAAAKTADWGSAQDFNLVITNAPGEEAWPITATNFMLMHKQPKDPQRSAATLAFFKWALENGQAQAAELQGSFHEAEHLGGDTDMVALIAAAVEEERRRSRSGRADHQIPMRPDHGQDILDDLKRRAQPGYPAIGRLKGLAELRGVMTALAHDRHGLAA